MKKGRQEKMLALISQYEINTQEELIARLRESGFEVTQATVSRDMRELKVSKMTTGKGTYRYVLPRHESEEAGFQLNTTLTDAISGVDHAGNLVVLKTRPGLANAVAVGIDSMNLPQVLGCVAGDDTIMIVSRDESAAEAMTKHFGDLMKRD